MKNSARWFCVLTLMFGVARLSGQVESFFGQTPPGREPVKFWPEILTSEKHPHGQLAFSPDGTGVFWSAMLQDGPEQTIFWSAFDGKTFSRPVIAPFAAESGNGGPAFSPDGRRLFFSTELAGPDASSPKTTAVCYVERSGAGWTKPVPIESTVDNRMTKGQVSVARSGNIYFSGRMFAEMTPRIYVSRCIDGRYSPPEKLVGADADVPVLVDPWIDPDERFLLVSCPGEKGPPMLTDIGICYRQADGSWSKPIRLGGSINTPAYERFPALSPDGKYLFFIRSLSEQFVGDQAHFNWIAAQAIAEIPKKQTDLQVLNSPYLGQKPPGTTPAIFAPSIVSKEGIQTKLTTAADGSEIIYSERDPANNSMAFLSLQIKGSAWADPVVLPFSREFVNMEPCLSPDGKRLLFISNRPVSGKGEAERTPDIWMAEKEGDGWGEPVHVGPPVDAASNADIEAHPFLGPDGSLYFMRQAGKARQLLVSRRIDGRFSDPIPVPFKEDLFQGQFSGPYISPDNRILLMHSRKEGGFGGWDLYVSLKDESGRWGELVNLGPAVNTDKSEADATFSPDGRYLFFSRDGDIFWVSANIIDPPGQKKKRPMQEE